MEPKAREEHAIVLDFLPNGYPFDNRPLHKKSAIIQAIGKDHFTLLELVPKKGVFCKPLEEVYLGEGKRDKVHHISGKLEFDKLTGTANSQLKHVVEDLVKGDQKQFVDFFNNAQPLSTRMHQLELLPGLGKKHMWEVLEQRRDKDFENFDDLRNRVKLLPDPEKAVIKRIMSELQGKEKYNIFVR